MLFFFFFNDTATTEIYTLSLHDALPISNRSMIAPGRKSTCSPMSLRIVSSATVPVPNVSTFKEIGCAPPRSEEHTSELQSQSNLVCRLLLEKKKKLMHAQLKNHVTLPIS